MQTGFYYLIPKDLLPWVVSSEQRALTNCHSCGMCCVVICRSLALVHFFLYIYRFIMRNNFDGMRFDPALLAGHSVMGEMLLHGLRSLSMMSGMLIIFHFG